MKASSDNQKWLPTALTNTGGFYLFITAPALCCYDLAYVRWVRDMRTETFTFLLIVTLLNDLLASEIALLISKIINTCYLQIIDCRHTQDNGLQLLL